VGSVVTYKVFGLHVPCQSLREHASTFMSDVEEENAADEGSGDEDDPTVKIQKVFSVRVGNMKKTCWLPDVAEVEGHVFARFSKWDSTLCKLAFGKGMQRHKSKEKRDLQVVFWEELRKLRH